MSIYYMLGTLLDVLHFIPTTSLLLFPFFRWENWVTERLCNRAKIMQLMMWFELVFDLTLEIANLSMRWNCEMMWTLQEGMQSRAKGLFKMVRLKGKGRPTPRKQGRKIFKSGIHQQCKNPFLFNSAIY